VFVTKNIKNILEQKEISLKDLAKLLGYGHGGLSNMINGKTPFTDPVMKKLLPVLEITQKEFESWVLADKYPKEVLELALEVKKGFPYKRKSILTTNIDLILKNKGMSRTALAKEINYSQSGLNRMIIGQISMSQSVIERLSINLDIPETKLKSWIAADKYSLQILELAINI